MTQKYKVSTSQPPSSLSLIALSIIGINSLMISSAVNAEVVELEKIVVTGEKIDKSIKDTTTAVTVFTEEKLESGETNQVKSLATKAPNVISDSFGHISMRGVNGGGAATGGVALITGARARISTVVDGTSQDWSGYNFAPTSLWDTKQVEILRGPQSTTQGASAIGGAMVINTNDPTFEQEAAIRLGLENYDNGNFKHNMAIMSSGALEDELAYRIAADQTKGSGWINYDTSGYTADTPDLDDSESQNFRGKLLWKPSSMPELSAKLTISKLNNDGEHANFTSNTTEAINSNTLRIRDTNTADSSITRVQDSTEDSFSTDIDYQISQGISNSLHISQIDSDIYADGYGLGTSVHTYDIDQKTKAVENRIIFNDINSDLTGVIGLFASDKKAVIDATQGATLATDYTTTTTALYGEGTYSITDKTKITTGLRIENEDTTKSGTTGSGSVSNEKIDKSYTLPKLAITHKISDTTTLGASVRKGYSPSGTYVNFNSNTVSSYDSEEVTTYEFSSKSDFGNGTTVNASIFYNDYTDYQAQSGFGLVNVDEATTYGAEIEATKWASENLELWGSLGLLRSNIDKYDATTSSEGNDLSSAPETNAALGFTQYIGDDWSFGADINYVGTYHSDLANSDSVKAGNYTISNAQAQYVMGELTINAYIKNITNEDAVYYRESSVAAAAQSRTVGLSAVYRM
ncbi:TonB-dependent receptor [Marinomonas sp. S3726]|uniref:TonB-dependent receptor n=1 Tax=Marinomonas sp. S3726 TaxID=579484 RepID=UPI0005FA593A|nr:TonB-dependent receptor [Marinomonas sp. S3726]KJZ13859.1 TonB-dependent receptor [Marinomonas sp. S3726]